MKTPWCQIKVGFDCTDIDTGDDDSHFYKTIREANLPEGWELNESYHSPIAYILIFEVEGKEVTKADGEAVQAIIDAYRKPKRRIQVQDDSATFRTVDLADLTENEFLNRIKECLLKGYTVDEGK